MKQLTASREPSTKHPTLDPILTLHVPANLLSPAMTGDMKRNAQGNRSLVSSVCFLPTGSNTQGLQGDEGSEDSSSDDDEKVSFRCRELLRHEKQRDGDTTASARAKAASLSLAGARLASCHASGEAFVWDLGRQRIVTDFYSHRQGPGMALRRLEGSNTILYHTRDANGTVSIHDLHRNEIVTQFETRSFTFCTAAPCGGNCNLLVLPTAHNSFSEVRDVRISPDSPPIVRFHGAGLKEGDMERRHGMLMSVAMSEANNAAGRPVVACGMESGTVFFHDLLMPGRALTSHHKFSDVCSISLGKDPVLGIDVAYSSTASSAANGRSFVSIVGLAGDAADLSELPEEQRGTVAVVKASFPDGSTGRARLRARVSTCEIGTPEEAFRGGKPGVGICRFRLDGRIFAVGGWDKRVRIFDRTGGVAPLAILKGHDASVTAVDWAPNSQSTGFLATGAGDGRISVWRCFPQR